jgi:ribosome production factor 1
MDDEEEMPEAGPSTIKPPSAGPSGDDAEGDQAEEEEEQQEQEILLPQPPPKIMITTSPSPCKLTYQFCDELKNVFPGGEFFKRPRGKGFELGRLARWGIKRGFGAVIVVNEDHKAPSTSLLLYFFTLCF